jgi:hypothetical protein
MANEYLSIAFEIIDLSNMAWMVTKGADGLTDNQKPLAEIVKKIMDEFPDRIDFIDNSAQAQPLGLQATPKGKKSSLNKNRLVEIAKTVKKIAVEDGTKDFLLRANKVLKTCDISNTYLKNREFFESRSAALDSANPFGSFMA